MLAYSYPLLGVFWTMLEFFAFFIWIWLLVVVFADIFRSHDMGGFAKALWVIFVIIVPFLGILIYLLVYHQGMAERNVADIKAQQEQIRQIAGTNPADQLMKLDELKAKGSISEEEYQKMRAQVINA